MGKSVGVCGLGGPTQTAISEQEIGCKHSSWVNNICPTKINVATTHCLVCKVNF